MYDTTHMFLSPKGWYYRFFAIHEIEASKTLQLLYYVVSFSFFVTFYGWIERNFVSISAHLSGTNICPPYFPSCGEYYFIEALPLGYSQSAFYVFLFLLLCFGVYSAYRKHWADAHLALLVCLVWKIIVAFFLTYGTAGNFDYYDTILAIVLLLLREKEYFARVIFVFLYVLASSIKIDAGWIFGNYFNSLYTGAPIFDSPYILPIFTNFLIIMQIGGAWLLLSNNKILQRSAFIYFFLFHLYSGIIVNYRYISTSIPALFVLFSEHKPFRIQKISRTTIAGYALMAILLCGQLTGIILPGDQKKTLEGNYYGLYMFEANHQCISTTNAYISGASEPIQSKRESHVANNRCDPYRYWFALKTRCERDVRIEKIAWTFDHSVNGGAYERIVDVEDACALIYHSFQHNDWILVDDEATTLDIPVYKTGFSYELPSSIREVPHVISDDPLLEKVSRTYWTLWIISLGGALIALLYVTFKRS
jgi:hypothetical protein